MSDSKIILVLEDEPLILIDLEFAAEDCGCTALTAATCDAALRILEERAEDIDVAILDVSLGHGQTCFPVAAELDRLKIPYILHSGDLDRHNEKVRELEAELVPKPAATDMVIATALGQIGGSARLRPSSLN